MRTTVDKQIPLTAGSSKQPVQSTGSNPPSWGKGRIRKSKSECKMLPPDSMFDQSQLKIVHR